MTPNPQLRRKTPLLDRLRGGIQRRGPLSVERYMRDCLFDPEHGYYQTARVLGRDGDFITAPEISQTFGELIGLWCVAVWQQMGAPQKFQLVEFGPGRGTLMADALRTSRNTPAFFNAVSVALFETHPGLRTEQAEALAPFRERIYWHDELGALEFLPTILIANEFLDCLPIEQFVATPDTHPGWQRRRVGVDATGTLDFTLGRFDPPEHAKLPSELQPLAKHLDGAPEGAIVETRNYLASELNLLGELFVQPGRTPLPFAGLFIDYGHTATGFGDTLQAVRNHAFEHPLTSPGEADLTAHVDFEQFGKTMRTLGFEIDGPVPQGAFLTALGIVQRGQRLAEQNPEMAAELELAIARLISPTGMGSRFHAIGIRTPNTAPLPGLSS